MSDNPFQAPQPYDALSAPLPAGVKKRHGCVTVWLLFCGIGVTLGLAALIAIKSLVLDIPGQDEVFTPSVVIFAVASSLLNLVFIVALWKFKRWGFYGWGVLSLVSIGITLAFMEGDATDVIGPLVGLAILYGILQIGRPSTWSQLE